MAIAIGSLFTVPFFTGGVMANGQEVKAEQTQQSVEINYNKLGEYLSGTAQSDSELYAASNVYNNSGMSGDDGITHTHTNQNAETKMWLSKPNDFTKTNITIELKNTNQLGYMFVWNYNEQGETENGMRKVRISTSEDGVAFTNVGDYEFAEASGTGNIKASNLQGSGEPIDLGGVTAKYVRIQPLQENGNWGGSSYGLSEVKIFEYKEPAAENAYIKAAPYHATDKSRVSNQYVLTNGEGMSDAKTAAAVHDNDPEHMWLAASSTLTFDLRGSYPLSSLYIWNYNDKDALDCGAKEIEVSYTVDGGKSTEYWDKLGTFTVPAATGSNEEKASLRIDFKNERARFVRFTIKSNYGGDKKGLSAVRFYCGDGAVVEPAHQWTSLLSNYSGFAGADGYFSVSMSGQEYGKGLNERGTDAKSFFVFSDTTVINDVDEVTRTTTQSVNMPNNSYAVFTGNDPFNGSIEFMYSNETTGSSKVPIRPETDRPGSNPRYWLGAPVVLGNKIYITPHFVEGVSYGMGFEQTGCDLAYFTMDNGVVDFDSYTLFEDREAKYLSSFTWPEGGKGSGPYTSGMFFNAGFLVNTEEAGAPNPDGYVYNYGYYDAEGAGKGRTLVLARCKPDEIEDFTKLEYYTGTGSGWSKNIRDVASLCPNVSTELSVTPITEGEYAGKYLLVYQQGTITQLMAARIADTPWGPFSEEIPLYYSTEPGIINAQIKEHNPNGNQDAYCYNAKAHPSLSNTGELILTYNMNYMGSGWTGIQNCVDCYHPRFLRLAYTDGSVTDGIIEDESENGGGGTTEEQGSGCSGSVAGVSGTVAGACVLASVAVGTKKKVKK